MSYKLTCAVDICKDEELDVFADNTSFQNEKGNHECVVFVKSVTNVPSTIYWKRGVHVQSADPGTIPKGTAIATFDKNGKYPTDSYGKHAALYQNHNNNYIEVLDQWKKTEKEVKGKVVVSGGKVVKRKIQFHVKNGTKRSNDGKTFYVIELITDK